MQSFVSLSLSLANTHSTVLYVPYIWPVFQVSGVFLQWSKVHQGQEHKDVVSLGGRQNIERQKSNFFQDFCHAT